MADKELKTIETIRSLQANHHTFLEKTTDAIIIVGRDGIVRSANPAAELLLGRRAEALLGEPFEFPLVAEREFTIASGERGTVTVEMRVVEESWGEESAYLVSLRDITEHKRAEEALRQSEEKYKTLTDNLNVGIFRNTPGPEGRFIEVNSTHARMLGYASREELLAVSVADLYQNPEDRESFSDKLSKAGSAREELQLKKKDGTPFIGLVSAVAVRDEKGKAIYFDGIIEDITEHKRAEEALRDSEERYRSLFEDSPISLWVEDFSAVKNYIDDLRNEGVEDLRRYFQENPEAVVHCAGLVKVIDVNKASLELYDADSKEELLAGLVKVFSEESFDAFRENLIALAEGKTVYNAEVVNQTLKGEKKYIAMKWSVAPNCEEALSRIYVSIIDITERKKAIDALQKSEEQLLVRETQAFAQGRLATVDTILHNIGNAINSVVIGSGTIQKHLVNNKLTRYLCSLASVVKDHQDHFGDYVENDPQGRKVTSFIIALADDFEKRDRELARTVDRVRESAERIADIVRTEEMLSGKGAYLKDINLRRTIDNAIAMLHDTITKRGIEVIIACENAPEEIKTQESRFNQMLVNLVKNSIEAVDELHESENPDDRPYIKITCYSESDSLVLEVTDNGIGIEEDNLKTIFTYGYTTKRTGSGVGLYSIMNFINERGGQILALSDGIGKGATMRVVLPRPSETS